MITGQIYIGPGWMREVFAPVLTCDGARGVMQHIECDQVTQRAFFVTELRTQDAKEVAAFRGKKVA